MKRIRQALKWIDARTTNLEEAGEGTVWDVGVDVFYYLAMSICIAMAL